MSVGTEKLETATLIPPAGETEVLQPPTPETTMLFDPLAAAGQTEVLVQGNEAKPGQFVLEVEMSFAASSEIIE